MAILEKKNQFAEGYFIFAIKKKAKIFAKICKENQNLDKRVRN